jgi:superoxide dismutase, Fe-Mn family
MPYSMKPLSCDPARVRGMSEKLIISNYDNNYGGAVKRLNVIEQQLAELNYANAPGFLINGLKREELVATNSMIVRELFFDGLSDQSKPGPGLLQAIAWSRRDKKLVNQWASDHCHTLAAGQLILALDMYEHS